MMTEVNWIMLNKRELIEQTWEFLKTMWSYDTLIDLVWDTWQYIYKNYEVEISSSYVRTVLNKFII